MGGSVLRGSGNRNPGVGLQLLGLVLVLVLVLQRVGAAEFQVGGAKGWSVPSDANAQSFNQWAEAHRFKIGDSLVFNYPAGQDSVLQVNQHDYESCNTDSPIKNFSGGHTVVKLASSGPHYFIAGNRDNCLKNQKLVVIVLADRTKQQQPSPPPANTPETAPPQPPEAPAQMNPSPSPIAEEPPANAAAAAPFVGLFGVAGAFAASALVL